MLNKESISNILYQLIKAGVLVILFCPLVISDVFFFPFIVPKNVLFLIVVEIIFAAYLLLAHLDSDFKPKFGKIFWALIAFCAVMAVATFTGLGAYRSFWGNYERMGGLFHQLHLVAYFFVLFNIFRTKKEWHSLLSFSVFVSVLLCFIGYGQWLQLPLFVSSGGARLTATVGNADFFAAYLLFHLLFLAYFIFKPKEFSLKVFSLSFLIFDGYLFVGAALNRIFPSVSWQIFDFLRSSFLIDTFKYPVFFYSCLVFQLLILAVWFLRSNRYYIYLLLGLTFVFEFFIFFSTQTRGAIIGFWQALVFLAFALFALTPDSGRKKIYGVVTAGLFLAEVIMYQYGLVIGSMLSGTHNYLLVSLGNTVSRLSGLTAIFAIYLSLIIILSLAVIFYKKGVRIAAVAILTVLILSPFFVYFSRSQAWVASNPKLNQLVDFNQIQDITTQSRLLTWEASWQGWTESIKAFLIGYGPENYYYVFNKHFPVAIYRDAGSQIWFDRAHNVIFDVGVTAGIIGLASYLTIIALIIWLLYNNYKRTGSFASSWLLIGLVIAYFIQNFFVFDTLNTEVLFYLLLAFIAYLSSSDEKEAVKDDNSQASGLVTNDKVNYIYITVLIVVLSFLILAVNVKILRANNYLFQALIIRDSEYSEEKFNLFEKAIEQGIAGRFEARQQLGNYLVTLAQNPAVTSGQVSDLLDYATDQLAQSVEEEPLNIMNRLILASTFDQAARFNPGLLRTSIQTLEDGIDSSPARPQLYFELGQAYALLGNEDKAVEYFNKGVDLAPQVIDSHWNLLAIYILTGRDDLASQEYQKMIDLGWQPTDNDYRRLINVYGRVKATDKMIEFAQTAIKANPSPDNYSQLALIYAGIGDNKKAEAVINDLIKVRQDLADQAKVIIEKINQGQFLKK